MQSPPTLSAVIIAMDEEQNLTELLHRLEGFEETIVVDGGSQDRTVDVARSFGCRVVLRRFDTFAMQRNFAQSLAQGDWILSLDADERPSACLIEEIRHRIRSTRHRGFRVPIRSTIFGQPFRYSGTQDDRPIRLFRRESGRWEGDVHEVFQSDGSVGRLGAWLEHCTLPDASAFLAKMHRYTMLEAEHRVAIGRPPRMSDWWYLPMREIFRRLVWKRGFLDGLAGWTFCLMSGFSEWNLAWRHAELWCDRTCISNEREQVLDAA